MKYFFILILFFFNTAWAALPTVELEKAHVNIHDKKSIERGAKYFATICMACHTMEYMRYDKIAHDAGVVYERMPVQVTTWPFGVKPPDLSLEINHRGADWVYTYLHSFYTDPSRPTGVNNLILPNTAMSGILTSFQGVQILLPETEWHHSDFGSGYEWYDLLDLQSHGAMTPEQFDAMVSDVVNFLAYASNPYQIEQEKMGVFVLIFLVLFFILAFLLKQSYWREIKRKQRK